MWTFILIWVCHNLTFSRQVGHSTPWLLAMDAHVLPFFISTLNVYRELLCISRKLSGQHELNSIFNHWPEDRKISDCSRVLAITFVPKKGSPKFRPVACTSVDSNIFGKLILRQIRFPSYIAYQCLRFTLVALATVTHWILSSFRLGIHRQHRTSPLQRPSSSISLEPLDNWSDPRRDAVRITKVKGFVSRLVKPVPVLCFGKERREMVAWRNKCLCMFQRPN